MAFTKPLFKRADVDRAGAKLLSPDTLYFEMEEVLAVINNWRSSHSYPLNTFQTTLRRKGRSVEPQCLIAQRIKRLSSIKAKMHRQTVRLSQMQDIGGCRAVVSSVSRVKALVRLYETSDLKHKLEPIDDYITKPRNSGYRGMHLIYRYHSDKHDTYEGLKIEMQIRSQLQHAWATAVETVGSFIQQALKSSQGEDDWLRFFALMGTVIAVRERSPPVPNTPTDENELKDELRAYAQKLDVERALRLYRTTLTQIDQIAGNSHYFLLKLDPKAETITVRGFTAKELELASTEYLSVEKSIIGTGAEAVLVSVESLAALPRAYPNYFADTDIFLSVLGNAVLNKPLPRRRIVGQGALF